MTARWAWVAVAALLALAPDGGAQTIDLRMDRGRVSLDARGVSVRQILERWSERTGVVVVRANEIPAALVTLRMTDVTEQDALEILLRGTAGYILVKRPGSDGAIDQIIFARSSPGGLRPERPTKVVTTSASGTKEVASIPLPDEQPGGPERLETAAEAATGRDTPLPERFEPSGKGAGETEVRPETDTTRRELEVMPSLAVPSASVGGNSTTERH